MMNFEYTANDMGVAMSYVMEGLFDTVEEALDALELDGLLDAQQAIVGWDRIEAGEEQ